MMNKKKKNIITAIVLVLFMIFLFALTFYNIGIYNRRFDTNINGTLDWKFNSEFNTLNLKPGEVHTVKFNVENPGNQSSSGTASFNVAPSPFGIYLNKIGCFCFEKQTLKAGENKEFVLTFFLDPKVVDDNKTKNISDVTLSFTFFSSDYFKKDNS